MTNTANTSKKPTYIAYQVREGNGGKSYWSRIGVAWQHSDSQGFNIEIGIVPLDGRIVLRIATERK